MSDLFFYNTHADDEPDRSSFSFAGAGSHRGHHVVERSSYIHPVHSASHMPSSIYFGPQGSALPPNDWPMDSPARTFKPVTTAQFDSPPSPLSPTLRAAPISLCGGGSALPYTDYSAGHRVHPVISGSDPHTVAMSPLTERARYGDGMMDAHAYRYGLSPGFPQDNCMVRNRLGVPSPLGIPIPTVPTSLGTSASHYLGSTFPSDPVPLQSPRRLAPAFQYSPPSRSTLNPNSPDSFDAESYSSSSPFYMDNRDLTASSPEMVDQTSPQPYMTTFAGQLYTLTVPLATVEFPPLSCSGEALFFQCRWGDCGIWISSEKEAVKDHLTRTHRVMIKGKPTDSVRCVWTGCSSSLQRNGLVRHFHTHLGLKWLCSVCNGAYTRQDSVAFHARREARCQLARAVSHPSAVAYNAKVNGDSTVTLTKVLQP